MSDREKTLAKQIAALPPKLQDDFLRMAQGAVMALDALEKRKEGGDDAERPSVPKSP